MAFFLLGNAKNAKVRRGCHSPHPAAANFIHSVRTHRCGIEQLFAKIAESPPSTKRLFSFRHCGLRLGSGPIV
jgi:hypothetical protein